MGLKSDLIVMAGPCSIESESMLRSMAECVKSVEGDYLRGGAFKPRTKAREWTGYGEKALEWMRKIGSEFGLGIVTEIMSKEDIPMFQRYGVDLYQVGARNAQNQDLLFGLGNAGVPVLLKNGMNTSLKEWLGSAGKIGNEDKVMLCPRGKNNETDIARNGQDITTLVELVNHTPYKIIFDPSHITGKREYVFGVTMAAIAAGVDGIIVEVHPDPIVAKTDGRQSITPRQLEWLVTAAHRQRKFYLEQKSYVESFSNCNIPNHVDIYFRTGDSEKVLSLLKGISSEPYYNEETGIMTARIPAGYLGVFRREGCAIGELIPYSPKEGESSAEGVHIAMPHPNKLKIRMSPFNEEALRSRGKIVEHFPGRRVEFVHGYPGQTIRDAYLTIDMKKVPQLHNIPLIIYQIVKE